MPATSSSRSSSASDSARPTSACCCAWGIVTLDASAPPRGSPAAGAHKCGRELTKHTLHVREKSPHRVDPAVVAAEPPYFLRGYLQSERYFVDVADELAAAIHLRDTPALGPGPVVAVSYRRGDYVGYPYLLPMTYYDAAIERVCAEVQPCTIVVFCDDHEFAALVAPRLERFAPTRGRCRPTPRGRAGGDGRVRPLRHPELVVRVVGGVVGRAPARPSPRGRARGVDDAGSAPGHDPRAMGAHRLGVAAAPTAYAPMP